MIDQSDSPSGLRAALYERVSTTMQKESGHSLDSQEEDLINYCKRRNWTVVNLYKDEAVSGRLVDRPGLQRLLGDVRAGKIDVVVVPNVSRFFRKLDTLLATMKIFNDYGVSFVSLSENLNFTTKWGKLILSVLGTLAEIYVDDLSETTSRGKQQRARKGLFNGSIPTGYCTGMCTTCTDPNGPGYCPFVGLRPIGDGRTPTPHPLESQAVQLAFEWYATGHFSHADIAYKLNQYEARFEGQPYRLRPKRKNGDSKRYTKPLGFTKDTIREILHRRFYVGDIEYRGGKGVAESRQKFKKAQAVYPGKHDPIVSRELYEQVQAVRRQRGHRTTRPRQPRPQRVYPLSRLLYAGATGSKMGSVTNGAGNRFYRDRAGIGRSRLDSTPLQIQPNVRAEPIERQAVSILNSLDLPAEWKQRVLAYLVSEEGGQVDVERQRQNLLAQFDRLKELYQRGDRTLLQYQQEKSRLEQALSSLLIAPGLDNNEVRRLLADLPALWDRATPAELKDLFEALFQKVYVEGQELTRVVAFPAFEPQLADSPIPVVNPVADLENEILDVDILFYPSAAGDVSGLPNARDRANR
jgi:DNA invertase Pin-like site-specific DNA recombinase